MPIGLPNVNGHCRWKNSLACGHKQAAGKWMHGILQGMNVQNWARESSSRSLLLLAISGTSWEENSVTPGLNRTGMCWILLLIRRHETEPPIRRLVAPCACAQRLYRSGNSGFGFWINQLLSERIGEQRRWSQKEGCFGLEGTVKLVQLHPPPFPLAGTLSSLEGSLRSWLEEWSWKPGRILEIWFKVMDAVRCLGTLAGMLEDGWLQTQHEPFLSMGGTDPSVDNSRPRKSRVWANQAG